MVRSIDAYDRPEDCVICQPDGVGEPCIVHVHCGCAHVLGTGPVTATVQEFPVVALVLGTDTALATVV